MCDKPFCVSRVDCRIGREQTKAIFYARAGVGTGGLYVHVRSSSSGSSSLLAVLDWVHSTLLYVGNHYVETSQE